MGKEQGRDEGRRCKYERDNGAEEVTDFPCQLRRVSLFVIG
jgi:hypothetical protein